MSLLSLELALVCLISSAMVHVSQAQNSPQDYLNIHNAFRSQVGVGPMTWNTTVAAYAQNYANKRATDCNLEHSFGPYGENIAEGGEPFSGSDAVKFFASEKPYYNYKSNRCQGDECLHYTQVVWRKSIHLGCARVKCKNGNFFIICSYDPPGNIEGDRPY